ncbi:Hypp5921 [Branchiostoma lanceolatum]|uniref:Hypp5921 protein n=1 Tax=Branchiostoma lanceolatum TaxID=7740 RepID=A0A8J9WH33_BRALA|nr:Hypp5921 [Branchiostoma lanceolatum]
MVLKKRHHIGLLGDVCEHLNGAHSPVARSAAVKANERAGLKGIWFPPRGRKGGCHQPATPAAILSSEFSPGTSARAERRMFSLFRTAAELQNLTEMGR